MQKSHVMLKRDARHSRRPHDKLLPFLPPFHHNQSRQANPEETDMHRFVSSHTHEPPSPGSTALTRDHIEGSGFTGSTIIHIFFAKRMILAVDPTRSATTLSRSLLPHARVCRTAPKRGPLWNRKQAPQTIYPHIGGHISGGVNWT